MSEGAAFGLPEGPQTGIGQLLEVMRLGRTRYADSHRLQEELVEARGAGRIRDTLVLTEHEPVITVGRASGARPSLAAADPARPDALAPVPVVEVERGGEATFHGPGQLVVYPIYLFPEGRRDLHRYLRDLEEVVIRMLAEVEVAGSRRAGSTGVWVGEMKLCSIGVSVRRWVAWHGFALNIHTDLARFRGFQPCGLDPEVMARVADLVEVPPGLLLFEVLAVKHFCEVFDLELPPLPARALESDPGPFGLPGQLPLYPG